MLGFLPQNHTEVILVFTSDHVTKIHFCQIILIKSSVEVSEYTYLVTLYLCDPHTGPRHPVLVRSAPLVHRPRRSAPRCAGCTQTRAGGRVARGLVRCACPLTLRVCISARFHRDASQRSFYPALPPNRRTRHNGD